MTRSVPQGDPVVLIHFGGSTQMLSGKALLRDHAGHGEIISSVSRPMFAAGAARNGRGFGGLRTTVRFLRPCSLRQSANL